MTEPINPLPSLIVDPATGDTDRAEDILEDLRALMKKHNCVLMMSTEIGQPNEIVLAKIIDPAMMKARAIAGVKNVSPMAVTWRKIDWTPKIFTGKLQ